MENTKCCEDEKLAEFRENFESLKNKYSLPNFEELCKDFDIEKSFEKESSFLLREIRRTMTEKISSVLHLFENLINPSSPPMFIFAGLKKLEENDKKRIKEIYKIFARLQIKSMKCDSIYSEENEVFVITEIFIKWQEIKQDIFKILDKFENALDEENNYSDKSYFR